MKFLLLLVEELGWKSELKVQWEFNGDQKPRNGVIQFLLFIEINSLVILCLFIQSFNLINGKRRKKKMIAEPWRGESESKRLEKYFVLIVHRRSPELCWIWSNSLRSFPCSSPPTIGKEIFDNVDGLIHDRMKSNVQWIWMRSQSRENRSKHCWAELSKVKPIQLEFQSIFSSFTALDHHPSTVKMKKRKSIDCFLVIFFSEEILIHSAVLSEAIDLPFDQLSLISTQLWNTKNEEGNQMLLIEQEDHFQMKKQQECDVFSPTSLKSVETLN